MILLSFTLRLSGVQYGRPRDAELWPVYPHCNSTNGRGSTGSPSGRDSTDGTGFAVPKRGRLAVAVDCQDQLDSDVLQGLVPNSLLGCVGFLGQQRAFRDAPAHEVEIPDILVPRLCGGLAHCGLVDPNKVVTV